MMTLLIRAFLFALLSGVLASCANQVYAPPMPLVAFPEKKGESHLYLSGGDQGGQVQFSTAIRQGLLLGVSAYGADYDLSTGHFAALTKVSGHQRQLSGSVTFGGYGSFSRKPQFRWNLLAGYEAGLVSRQNTLTVGGNKATVRGSTDRRYLQATFAHVQPKSMFAVTLPVSVTWIGPLRLDAYPPDQNEIVHWTLDPTLTGVFGRKRLRLYFQIYATIFLHKEHFISERWLTHHMDDVIQSMAVGLRYQL